HRDESWRGDRHTHIFRILQLCESRARPAYPQRIQLSPGSRNQEGTVVLIFDQLKKNDPQLRIIAVLLLCGLGVLVAGLWWVQIVSSRDYQAHLEMQSFRTVRIPAVRGKILDRDGNVLAENRPTYNVSLYLDDFRKSFDEEAARDIAGVRRTLQRQMDEKERSL